MGCDDGVLGGIVEIAEIRCNRLTGEQFIRCGFKVALIEGSQIQVVGVVARNIAVLNSGVQILYCGSTVATEGVICVFSFSPFVPRATVYPS